MEGKTSQEQKKGTFIEVHNSDIRLIEGLTDFEEVEINIKIPTVPKNNDWKDNL